MFDPGGKIVLGAPAPLSRHLVWCPAYGQGPEDGLKITAFDADDAATEWAETTERDASEYLIAEGEEVTVHVRDVDTGAETAFVVRGELVPSYFASRITEEEAHA